MTRKLEYRALSSKVLAVASVNTDVGDWSAYIDAVQGENHDVEVLKVADEGAKLSHDIARILFPNVNQKYRWRN
jgi:hypothetical protein